MKRLLRPLWALTRPVRARLAARLDAVVYAAVARAFERSGPAREVADEVGLVLDAVLAEQVRLREQVEALERRLDEVLTAEGAGVEP
jgi:hypothetical protein